MGKYKGISFQCDDVYNFAEKELCVNNHIRYMLARTQSMFTYENLPDTIPQRSMELLLQINGYVCITDKPGALYALHGGLGGEPDPYYMPTLCTVANPALNFSKSLRIGEECVIIPNDDMYTGLMPMFRRYSTALCENELSMKMVTVNSRQASTISASDDKTLKSAEKYLADIEAGKMAAIGEQAFFDGIKVQPYGSAGYTNALITLIEHEQYIKASWYNDLGLNANYNMKREAINSNESQLNDDMLMPLVDNMLKCRKEGIEKINAMYGTNINVDFSSSWKENVEEHAAELNAIKNEAGGAENEIEES